MPIFNKAILAVILATSLLFSKTLRAQNSGEQHLPEYLDKLAKKHKVGFSYDYTFLKRLAFDTMDTNYTLAIALEEIYKKYSFLGIKNTSEGQYSLYIRTIPSLTLRVFDNVSRANIYNYRLTQKSGSATVNTSDNDHFILKDLSPKDTIIFSAINYGSRRISAVELIAINGYVELEFQSFLLTTVKLSFFFNTGITQNRNFHSVRVNMKKLGLLAGETDGDIFQLFEAIPGVRSPNGNPGNINIRGNVFSQNLFYYDHIPVYHNGHFFGSFSPYNPKITEKVEIFKNSLPSYRGGRVGGLIEMTSSNDALDSISGGAFMNTVFAGMHIKAPIVKGKLGVLLAFRSNYGIESAKLAEYSRLNFQGSKIDFDKLDDNHLLDKNEVDFNDINAKIIYRANSSNRIEMSFLNIRNATDHIFLSLNEDQSDQNISTLNNWGSSIKWGYKASSKLKIESIFSLSELVVKEEKSNESISTGFEKNAEIDENQIQDIRILIKGDYKFSDQTSLTAGYERQEHDLYFNSLRLDSGLVDHINNRNDRASINSAFLNLKQYWNKKSILNIGLRTNHYSSTDQWFLEPRLSYFIALGNHFSAKSSLGRSHQYIQQYLGSNFNDFKTATQFWILANENQNVLSSDKAMIGASYRKDPFLIDIEFYGQIVNDVSRKDGPEEQDNGEQRNIGIDLLLRYSIQNWQPWISYSVSQTNLNFTNEALAYFNQTHVLSLNLSYSYGKFKATTSWSYMSGLPINTATTVDLPYTDNFPDQHQLDFSATYNISPKSSKWKGVIGVSLINVYDQEIIINQFSNAPGFQNSLRYSLGFTPGIQLSIRR